MPIRLDHVGGAPETTLTGSISPTDLSFTVADGTGYPTGVVGPFYVVLDAGTANEEKVLCSARSGNTFTVVSGGRGSDDTTGVAHSEPASVRHIFTATEADEANAHLMATTQVHGVVGAVVGTTDPQTLTGKTMSGITNNFSNIPQAAVVGLVDVSSRVALDALADAPSSATLLTSASYDVGHTVKSATLELGYPTNGILTTEKHLVSADRGYQVLHTASGGAAAPDIWFRHWRAVDGWSVWRNAITPSSVDTLVNKTISGSDNTLSGISQSSVNGLVSALAKIADIANIGCGFREMNFDGSGIFTFNHGLGWTPHVMMFAPHLVSGAGGSISVQPRSQATPFNSTQATCVAKVTDTGIAYTQTLSRVGWIAARFN